MTERRFLPRAIRIFFVVALALDLLGAGCEVVARHVLHLGAPYSSPVLNERWACDLTNYMRLFRFIHTPRFFQTVRGIRYEYPAPIAPLYGFFLSLPRPVVVFECTLAALFTALTVVFWLYLKRRGLSAGRCVLVAGGALLLSYPAAFELRQGNMELFCFLLVAIGIWSFVRGRFHTAAVMIGVAGAMKIFPFVYLGLFLARNRYRHLITAALAAVIVTVPSLLYMDASLPVAWHGVQAGLATYQREMSPAALYQTSYDHSIFALVKMFPKPHAVSLSSVRLYLAIVATCGVVVFFTRIRRMPVINQVLCLCLSSILLPPVSFDYTLINLYIPWAMLVGFALDKGNVRTAGLAPVFVCLAVATSIQTEVIFGGHSVEGQIKCIALGVLMVFALRYPFQETYNVASPA